MVKTAKIRRLFHLRLCTELSLGSRHQVSPPLHHQADARIPARDYGPARVHALLDLPPNLDLSRFVNNVKTTSSRLLRRDFGQHLRRVYRKPVFWSRSYCIISCGGAPLSVIRQYVEQQKSPD